MMTTSGDSHVGHHERFTRFFAKRAPGTMPKVSGTGRCASESEKGFPLISIVPPSYCKEDVLVGPGRSAPASTVMALQKALGHSTMAIVGRCVHYQRDDLLDAWRLRRD
jgi:hypothetical protein